MLENFVLCTVDLENVENDKQLNEAARKVYGMVERA